MNNNKISCDADFYKNTGFNLIRIWLKENCLCDVNKEYFETLTPLINVNEINKSQLLNDEFLAAFERNDFILNNKIPNINNIISSLNIIDNSLNIDMFKKLYEFLKCTEEIKLKLKKKIFPLWYNNAKKLLNSKKYTTKIMEIFDKDFVIKKNASENLTNISNSIFIIEEKINRTMNQFLNTAKKNNWLQDNEIVFRNGRSMLPFKNNKKRKIKGVIYDQSATGLTVYVEPLKIIELNNQLIELYYKLKKEKIKILKKLTSFFIPISNKIKTSFNILIHLDQHLTIVKLSYKIKGKRPKINTSNEILIEDANNPIFILNNKKSVPLNLKIKNNQILILSGPNAGGKTIVLKSIGLYALMAQCGIFISAKKIHLPIFKTFMSDIGDNQSLKNDLSTFSAHIKNLSYIISKANNSSLVLLDELGTGTEPNAAAALSQSILEELIKLKSTVIATTHLGALKIWAINAKNIINGGMIFNTESLCPTFELHIGYPGSSYTLEISKQMGLKEKILKRSQKLLNNKSIKFEDILSNLKKIESYNSSLKSQLEIKQQNITKIEKELKQEKDEIKEKINMANSSAILEAQEIILNTRKKVENIITSISTNKNNHDLIVKNKKEINKILDNLYIKKKKNEKEIKSINVKQIKLNTKVYIPKLNTQGKIIQLPDKKNYVKVLSNGITVKLNIIELKIVKEKNINAKKLYIKKERNIKNQLEDLKNIQLDLRGIRINEALEKTEKFLDKAILSGFYFVNILHGKGNGILMTEIHNYLKNQTIVKKFNFAAEEQGGAGITVVQLK